MGSLVCIGFKSRSLLRRGNPKFDLENLRSSFFRGSVEETTTFNYLEAQKGEGKRIVLHTHILLQTENSTEETWLFVAVVSINHQSRHIKMKLALSTLVVVVFAALLERTESSPIVGPFAGLLDSNSINLPRFRIPTMDQVISTPGRVIDSGMRSFQRQSDSFGRAMSRASDRFGRGLRNLSPDRFMQTLSNMVPDFSGLPLIG